MGIVPTTDALNAAREAGLDLVEVSPHENPPVARIMDFGKFKYQQSKRHSHSTVRQARLKEIRVRPKTGEHDIEVKVKHAREFLEHRDKVLITVVFRGRELAHIDEGRKLLANVVQQLADVANVESPASQQAKRLTCLLAPR